MKNGSNFTLTFKKILNRSVFTERQTEVLLDYLQKKENGEKISYEGYVITHQGRKYRKSVYFRILKQAMTNFKKVIFSVILLTHLGIISHDEISKLISIILDMETTEEAVAEIIEILERNIEKKMRKRM